MMRLFAMLVAMLLLSACSQEDIVQRFSSPTDRAEAQAYINQLRSHDYEGIERAMDDRLKVPNIRSVLSTMGDAIPATDPTSIKLVGSQTKKMSDVTIVNSTFEYQFGQKWLLINVAVRQQGNARTIVGFNVTPLATSLESQNRFSLSGKSIAHYGVLVAAVLSVLITLVALVAWTRTKFTRRGWLWLLFILFGFGQFAFNWTTGGWSINPLSVHLFSAGTAAAPYGPWTILVSIPVGAICFLYSRLKRTPVTAPA